MMSRTSSPPEAAQAGRKPRRILAPIVAGAFSVAMLAAIAGPASAATTRSAAPASPAVATTATVYYSPNLAEATAVPNSDVWVLEGYYGSYAACADKRDIFEVADGFDAHCTYTQTYSAIWEWALWVLLP